MALEQFKNIDEVINKGTSLTTELNPIDLALINQGFKATPFNLGVNDVLEFILYDSANNILEQKDYGKIRYVKGQELNDYLIQSENVLDKVLDGGGFLVDIKKLIKEAGYNVGVFRVQLNFVNDRVGSSVEKDKMWIQEISATRLELRLLPYDNFDETSNEDIDTKIDLNQSYNSFVLNKFSGDEVYSEIDAVLNALTPAQLYNTFQSIKAKAYIEQLGSEFGINSWEIFFSKVLDSMRVAVRHALLHKNSTIGSNTFGAYLGDDIDFIYYNKADIVKLLNDKFEEAVDYHLPKRTLSDEVKLDNITQQSIDKLQELVQSLKSDMTRTNPQTQKFVVEPPTIAEVKDLFTTTKTIIPAVIPGDKPIVIETPVLKEPFNEPIAVTVEPSNPYVSPSPNDGDIERERLRRLQEEMMYQAGGRGTQFDVPYQSPYQTPSQPIQVGGEPVVGGAGGLTIERASNDDYIRDYERNNVENIL